MRAFLLSSLNGFHSTRPMTANRPLQGDFGRDEGLQPTAP